MAPSPSWSLLPPELLEIVFNKLSLPDCFMFHKVCSSWRSVFLQRRSMTRPPPCMVLADIGTAQPLYSLHHGRLLKLRTPKLKLEPKTKDYIVGSSMGWLVIAREPFTYHLLNPVSNKRIPIPRHMNGCIYKVVLSTVPTLEDCILVMRGFIYRERAVVAWCRPRASKWIYFNEYNNIMVQDMMFHRGKLYVFRNNIEFDVQTFGTQPEVTGRGCLTSIRSVCDQWSEQRMTHLCGEHMVVGWRPSENEDNCVDKGNYVDVFKQADEPGQWVRARSLGDRLLLATRNFGGCLECINPVGLMGSGFEPNCIYSDGFGEEWEVVLVKFSMTDGSSQRIHIPLAGASKGDDLYVHWILPQAW